MSPKAEIKPAADDRPVMLDEQPPPSPARRPWVPVALVTGAVVAVSLPLGFLTFRRIARARNPAKLPPRRTGNAGASALPRAYQVETLPSTSASASAASKEKPSAVIRALIKDIVKPGPPVAKARPPLEVMIRMVAAFGAATAGVGATAAATIWGSMAILGVNNVHEFSYRMRSIMSSKMPGMTSRIQNLHVYAEEESVPDYVLQWTWEAARERLQNIYDTEGFLAWSEAALEEMEIEARLERYKRNQLEVMRPHSS